VLGKVLVVVAAGGEGVEVDELDSIVLDQIPNNCHRFYKRIFTLYPHRVCIFNTRDQAPQ
jgi:hypothetical protein